MRRNTFVVAGGIALVVLLAGCDGQNTGAETPEVPSVSGAATPSSVAPPSGPASSGVPASSEAAPPPASNSTPKPASNPAECKVADLELSLADGEGTAGRVYRQLRFTNVGGRTCTIQGFPGVSYVTGEDGQQVGQPAFREGAKGQAISLKPGRTVFAPLGFVQVRNFDPAVCKPTPVRGLRVYPPHEYDSMFVPAPGTGCAGNPPGHQLVVRTIQ
ncbi:DUF4232 domain-containing protein [Actinophytocola xanthii]|uniref:DUF4232 domain-containing protein n=1 Tax=Actinophytocola xanthii TaxID=1912961 RepID=A0A1Q8C7S3_9PSEU|nr:DUF4232 domain-containing protein [Actinophytocola xanthii]OLF10415.1 hypothetical protein BU204_31540 [Actinophytocola xanthii]